MKTVELTSITGTDVFEDEEEGEVSDIRTVPRRSRLTPLGLLGRSHPPSAPSARHNKQPSLPSARVSKCVAVAMAVAISIGLLTAVLSHVLTDGRDDKEETCLFAHITYRLPTQQHARDYALSIDMVNVQSAGFTGTLDMGLDLSLPSSCIALHARDLSLTTASVSYSATDGQRVLALIVDIEQRPHDIILLHTRSLLPASTPLVLHTEYSGVLARDLAGLYDSSFASSSGAHTLIVTDFEPTDARRLLPCMDEPHHKAVFTVTVTADDGLMVLGNTRGECSHHDVTLAGVSRPVQTCRFAPTPPMSPYLLALSVGDIQCRTGHAAPPPACRDDVAAVDSQGRGCDDRYSPHPELCGIYDSYPSFIAAERCCACMATEVSVCAQAAQQEFTEFPLEVAIRVIEYFTSTLGTPYMLPKAHLIAIPDFSAGAMENWGLVTFRESALLASRDTSDAVRRQRVATVVAHELAHQWFGNLVTCEWWDDIWLNEGLASYFEYLGTDGFADSQPGPAWAMEEHQFYLLDHSNALRADAGSTHPLSGSVLGAGQERALFDTISYSKGGTVLRMLRELIKQQQGQDRLLPALTDYLARHRFGNTISSDLLHSVGVSTQLPTLPAMMSSWVYRDGFPLVHVTAEAGSHHNETILKLSQTKYSPSQLLEPSQSDTGSDSYTVQMMPFTVLTHPTEYPNLAHLSHIGVTDCTAPLSLTTPASVACPVWNNLSNSARLLIAIELSPVLTGLQQQSQYIAVNAAGLVATVKSLGYHGLLIDLRPFLEMGGEWMDALIVIRAVFEAIPQSKPSPERLELVLMFSGPELHSLPLTRGMARTIEQLSSWIILDTASLNAVQELSSVVPLPSAPLRHPSAPSLESVVALWTQEGGYPSSKIVLSISCAVQAFSIEEEQRNYFALQSVGGGQYPGFVTLTEAEAAAGPDPQPIINSEWQLAVVSTETAWYTYEVQATVEAKVQWLREAGLGGLAIRDIGSDRGVGDRVRDLAAIAMNTTSTLWNIPIRLEYGMSDSSVGQVELAMSAQHANIALPIALSSLTWVFPNTGAGTGFFRTSLSAALSAPFHTAMSQGVRPAIEVAHAIDDAFTLAFDGHTPFADVLRLVQTAADFVFQLPSNDIGAQYALGSSVLGHLKSAVRLLANGNTEEQASADLLRSFVGEQVLPSVMSDVWAILDTVPIQNLTNHTATLTLSSLIEAGVWFREPETLTRCSELFVTHSSPSSPSILPRALRTAVYSAGVTVLGTSAYEWVWERFLASATDASEYTACLQALALAPAALQPDLLRRTLAPVGESGCECRIPQGADGDEVPEVCVSGEEGLFSCSTADLECSGSDTCSSAEGEARVRRQDKRLVIAYLAGSPVADTHARTWAFLQEHWVTWLRLADRPSAVLGYLHLLSTETHAGQLETFFAEHPSSEVDQELVDSLVSEVRRNGRWIESNSPGIADWVASVTK